MLAFETEETQQYLIYFSSVTLETSLGSDVQDLHIRNKNALQTQRSCIFFCGHVHQFLSDEGSLCICAVCDLCLINISGEGKPGTKSKTASASGCTFFISFTVKS